MPHQYSFAAVAMLTAVLSAQDIVCPDIYANAAGPGTSGLVWRNSAMFCQVCYDTTHFTGRGLDYPMSINRLQWRSNTVGSAGSYAQVDVYLSSAATDYAGMQTTFALNQGTDRTLVYSGPVNFIQGNGQSPGNYVVDITLTTPFTYNPTSGNDLLIEMVTAAAPTAAPPQMDCSTDYLLARGRRNSAASATATVGGLSAFVPVVKIGFTDPPGLARNSNFGRGCYNRASSFYELFQPGTFDLGGTATTVNSILVTPIGNGGYTVNPGSNGWFTPTSPDLALADDALSTPQVLPFTFPYAVSGSSTAVEIGSNGSVWLQPGGSTAPGASPAALLAEGARFVGCWNDLDPSAATGAGSVHFDVDPSNQVVYATWLDVPLWEAAPSPWAHRNTFQIALYSTGQVEFRYQAMDLALYQVLVGYSQGGGAWDPESRDLSASIPFITGDDTRQLVLNCTQRPIINTNPVLETRHVPAGAAVGGILLSFNGFLAGLPIPGAAGCSQYVGLDASFLLITGGQPTVNFPLPVPNNNALVGSQFYCQSAMLLPGINLLGVLTSNGVSLQIGSI